MKKPIVICPNCGTENDLDTVLTAQSNQNVIYECPDCRYILRNIEISKG